MVMRFLNFLVQHASRVFEEILPFISLLTNMRTVRKKPTPETLIKRYSTLSEQTLLDRIKEEQNRGTNIEDKTFKFHGSLAIGLTLINSTLFLLAGKITCPRIQLFVNVLISCSVLYLFIGAFIALYGIKTHQVYGYGTEFLVQLKDGNSVEICATALVNQEKENCIRHLLNEASFQSVRNGLICFFLAILAFILFLLTN